MPSQIPNAKKNSFRIDFAPVPSADFKDDNDTPDPENLEDTLCGFGNFHPTWLQGLNTPKVFLINHSLLGVLQGAFFAYLVGCLSTLEKRYAYESKVTGIIMIADEISPILFGMLLGYFGGKSHRPRIVVFGMLVAVLSCFMMAVPYFIYGPIREFGDSSVRHVANRTKYEVCDLNEKDYFCEKSPTLTAVSFLFLGNFMKGFGSLAFYTIGTSFLDDNVKKKNSPVYFGTLFALRLLGPTSGFLLSSLCLNFYEDPFFDPGYGTKDPRWIGAWWLGFIILGVAIFIFSLPMLLFPRRFPGKKSVPSPKKADKSEHKSPTEQLKDMGKAMKRLSKNPILICHYLGGVFRLNGLVGYYVLLPKYMEMQFRQSASTASLYSGPAGLVGMMIGIMFGGVAIRKWKPRPRLMTGGIVIAETFSVIALVICMLITCPHDTISTINRNNSTTAFNLENKCNSDCLCTTKVYTPICGPDGETTYFSPCYAGCGYYNKTDGKETFMDCKCVHDHQGEFMLGNAKKNYCNFECQWMITFIIVLSLGKMLSSTARVGNALVTLRCVDPQDKSLALGALSGIFSLLAFIPYPLIYGALTDASCLVWEQSCGKTGNCWIYDTDKFRYLLHGTSAIFVFLGCVTDVLVCILSPRLRNLYDDEDVPDTVQNGGPLGVIKTGMPNGGSIASLDETEKTTTPL